MKILFLCQYFPPEPGAPAARTHEHTREWVRQGHDVTVICGIPNHPDGEVPRAYKRDFIYEEIHDDVQVLRVWFYVTPNRGKIRRSISFLSFMFASLFWGIFRGGRADVVVATSPQLLCGAAGYLLSRIKRCPFVFEVRDLWPDQIVDLGVIRNQRIITWLRKLESFLYEKAAAIVTVAEAVRQKLIERGLPPGKVHTITNAIALDIFAPRDRIGTMRHRYGWSENFLVMYIGTHGMSQGLETVIAAAEKLQDVEGLRFVFVGAGAERENLMALAGEKGLENVEFIPAQPRAETPDFYAAADLCLVPLKKKEVFLTNIPSKMFEIMACARPILLGAEGQARELLEAANAGVAYAPEDADALVEAVRVFHNDPDQGRLFGENGRRYVEQHCNRALKAQEMLDVLFSTTEK
ncbi:MAG: glycosyltransferase family 4 protein [Candidatus Hydrogenedens sp.]|jgi:glycosyltransferase involved in cell wall biosynthesis|nr:glycosyltransferase family 4 protein [Candidatus Hydrogenedens sp.]